MPQRMHVDARTNHAPSFSNGDNFIDTPTDALLESQQFWVLQFRHMNPRKSEPVTVDKLRATYNARRREIRARLREFDQIFQEGSDDLLWEEMVYCIFTAGASAASGFAAVNAVRPLLNQGTRAALTRALKRPPAYRFHNVRAEHIVATRTYLQKEASMRLRAKLISFRDPGERRDWLARNPGIKGLGYKEASHYLRNIGFKGYAILDKHIVRCLAEIGVIDSPKPPTTRSRYLETEARMREFSRDVGIDFEELDLALWSMKTGRILK
jgi:N-glycosylase/DNA lyase